MKKFYVANACLAKKHNQVIAVLDGNQQKTQIIENQMLLTVLELFVHERSLEVAYRKYQSMTVLPILGEILRQNRPELHDASNMWVRLADQSLQVITRNLHLDLSDMSRKTFQVITALFHQEPFVEETSTKLSFEAFKQAVHDLLTVGLLSPAQHTIDWGDLRRRTPLCPVFGLTRGTPIDRYYLKQFIREIRSDVTGTVLEVGGDVHNRELYQFENATAYQTLDVADRPGVTTVGDVHDPAIMRPASLDAVVIFNVLEHCHHPWAVVQNIYRWLRVTGKCFCMVPSAQKLHDFPCDYWRLLPEGMRQLFGDFSQQTLYVYGNPITVIASFMGIAAEELSAHELDDVHPDYPVATCLVATK